ncbi:hypothetical protein [Maribacter forsetii]|uniref:hypothetical protein n=1 Tax=Maribacter forsetii TaxID=444515 RepID=UPI00055E7A0B|nr:hypothetical protein [Maribacter forsetii]
MFGIFKKQQRLSSPEDKLKHDMRKNIENMALLHYDESPMKGTPLEGMALVAGISQTKEYFVKRSISISQHYGVSRENTILIIENCAKMVHKDFIE